MHMNDPALQILDLDDSALEVLHESLHKSQDAPTIELHHLVTTEMLKRGGSHNHIDDFWTKAIIETSYIQDADLDSLGNGYSTDFVKAIKESTGSDTADVRIVLTVDGYEMRIEPVEKRELSARVETALEAKVTEHNAEVDDDSKTTSLVALREVFKRGIGAYRTNPSSVRPNVSGPDQWAMARVNAFLYALRNGKFRSGKFDTDLLPKEHPMSSKDKVEKMIREENGKYVVYNESGSRKFGSYATQEEAEERLEQMERFKKSATYVPPQGVREAARRALDWIEEGKQGSGFTSVGRRRAQQLAAGEKVSRDTVLRMKSFLARHAVDRKAEGFNRGEKGYPSAGRVAWDAWGGDEGRTWVNGILSSVEKAYDPMEGLTERQNTMYRDYENLVAQFGTFNQSANADGAHYFGKEENPFAAQGMNCSNCVFYMGGGGCEIVEGRVQPMGLCKLWIIPESLIETPIEVMPSVFIEKHREGQHDQKTHGSWADGIADSILRGDKPSIESKNLTAFLSKAALRDDHPDITELRIDGTPLYGEDGLGIERKDMPQVPGKRRKEFLDDIARDKGVTSTIENVDPRTLQPIQKEVSAARAGAIYRKFADKEGIPEKERILISADGYVVDGHHTWAASVGYAFDSDAKLPVYRLSVNAKEALEVSLEWTKSQGIEGQAIDAKIKKMREAFAKHGDHNQGDHGNWAKGSRGDLPALFADQAPIAGRSSAAALEAQNLRARAEAIEPQITGLMMDLAQEVGGEFPVDAQGNDSLRYRVKTTDSLARKIDADAEKQYNGDRAQAAAAISDSVRYTLNMPDARYTNGVTKSLDVIEQNGWKVVSAKNFWQKGDPYDGINVKLERDGFKVELQLHTKESHTVKERDLHPVYEKYRTETNDSNREQLWNEMVVKAESVKRPRNYNALLAIGTVILQTYETAQQAGLTKSTPVSKIWFVRGGFAECVIS